MNFQDLLSRMKELDQPAQSTAAIQSAPVEECGSPMMGSAAPEQPHTPPSMSINLNAQGLEDIEDLMALIKQVNPDMNKEPIDAMLPSLIPPGPSISSIKPELPPLKMLPDFDKEPEGEPMDIPAPDSMNKHSEPDADNMGGPSDNDTDNKGDDDISKAQGDIDNDGDHDMDDHDAEKDKPKEKDEAFGNSAPGDAGPDYKDVDAAVPDGNDMHKPKQMYKHNYRGGDNPMSMPESDLRSMIRAELLQRLAEAKGAK